MKKPSIKLSLRLKYIPTLILIVSICSVIVSFFIISNNKIQKIALTNNYFKHISSSDKDNQDSLDNNTKTRNNDKSQLEYGGIDNRNNDEVMAKLSDFEELIGLQKPMRRNLILREVDWLSRIDLEPYFPKECINDNEDLNDKIKFFRYSDNEQNIDIAKILCFQATPNSMFKMVIYPNSFDNPLDKKTIPVYSFIEGEYILPDASNFDVKDTLSNIFDFDHLGFKSIAKARASGECGIYYLYQFVPEKVAIYPIEERDKACNNETDNSTSYENWDLTYKIDL